MKGDMLDTSLETPFLTAAVWKILIAADNTFLSSTPSGFSVSAQRIQSVTFPTLWTRNPELVGNGTQGWVQGNDRGLLFPRNQFPDPWDMKTYLGFFFLLLKTLGKIILKSQSRMQDSYVIGLYLQDLLLTFSTCLGTRIWWKTLCAKGWSKKTDYLYNLGPVTCFSASLITAHGCIASLLCFYTTTGTWKWNGVSVKCCWIPDLIETYFQSC